MALINARSLVNKTFLLNDFIMSAGLEVLFVTETWLKPGDLTPFSELLPHDYAFINTPSETKRGGGLTLISKKQSCMPVSTRECLPQLRTAVISV